MPIARGVVVLAAAVIGVAITARLGVWQLDRAAQKNAWAAQMAAQRALPLLPATDLARDEASATVQRHRSVVIAGRWLVEHTVYLDNRQMNGRPGFYVLTPLLLADATAVFVQRGWVPRDLQDRTRIAAAPAPGGAVEVQGRIAPAPSRLYEFAEVETGPIRQNLALDAFARETGLRLRPLSIVQEDGAAPPADGLLRQWPQVATGVAKHHGYAFQWFALSALITCLYVWFQVIRPRRRQPAGVPAGPDSRLPAGSAPGPLGEQRPGPPAPAA